MEKKYLGYQGLQDVAGHVNTRLKTVTTIPASADDGAVRLYVGETSSTYTKGHIYQYNATDLEWVDITGSSEYTAGNGIDIVDNEISVETNIFTGTQAEWDALTTDEKKEYQICNITDDGSTDNVYTVGEVDALLDDKVDTNDIVDTVENGNMRPVTSNATRDVIYNLEDALKWKYITGTPISPVTNDIFLYYNAIACNVYLSIPAGEYTCNQLYSTDYYYVRLASYTMADVKTAFPGAENVAIGKGISVGRFFSNQVNSFYTCYLVRYNTSTWYFICNKFRSQTSGTKITTNAVEYLYSPHSPRTNYYGFPEI